MARTFISKRALSSHTVATGWPGSRSSSQFLITWFSFKISEGPRSIWESPWTWFHFIWPPCYRLIESFSVKPSLLHWCRFWLLAVAQQWSMCGKLKRSFHEGAKWRDRDNTCYHRCTLIILKCLSSSKILLIFESFSTEKLLYCCFCLPFVVYAETSTRTNERASDRRLWREKRKPIKSRARWEFSLFVERLCFDQLENRFAAITLFWLFSLSKSYTVSSQR